MTDLNKQKAVLALKNDTSRSISEICEILGVCRNIHYKCVRSEESANELIDSFNLVTRFID